MWRIELYGLRKIKIKGFFFPYLKGRGQDNKIIPGTNGVFGRNLLINKDMS